MKDKLNKIYNILVEAAGASEQMRDAFISMHSEIDYPHEWRFMGKLGFGGKFWRMRDGKTYINCYSEDENPERKLIIKSVNEQLGEINLLNGK